MAIPVKVSQPLISYSLPVSKKKIHYRPFTVKEEKILLIASENDNVNQLMTAFKQVINNCLQEDYEVGKLPLFDLEVLFLLIRAAAVNNQVSFQIRDQEDGNVYDINFDINSILEDYISQIVIPDKRIQLTDEVGVIMHDLSFDLFLKSLEPSDNETEVIMRTLARMIESIYDADNVYKTEDFSEDEVLEFIEGMPAVAMAKMNEYFDKLPRLRLITYYETPNGKKPFILEGLNDFFQYV